MKIQYFNIILIVLMLSLAACGDKDNEKLDTITGSTRPAGEEPDTISGGTRPAEGSIVKGRIGLGTITVDGQTYTNAYGIDFNKDGYLEFRIINNGSALQWEPADADGNLVRGPAMQNGSIALLQKHATIGSNLEYSTSIYANLPDNSTLPERFYVAFRLGFGATFYGWAKVKYEDGELEWDKCAYNTTAGGTITAGDD